MGIGFCVILPNDPAQIDQAMTIAKEHGAECYRLGHTTRDAERKIFVKPYRLVGKRDVFRPS
jgi:phosphoribosylaminoimidazole (AIR) synthetase